MHSSHPIICCSVLLFPSICCIPAYSFIRLAQSAFHDTKSLMSGAGSSDSGLRSGSPIQAGMLPRLRWSANDSKCWDDGPRMKLPATTGRLSCWRVVPDPKIDLWVHRYSMLSGSHAESFQLQADLVLEHAISPLI